MFGDLFGEEGDSSSHGTGNNKEQKSSRNAGLPLPPLLRGSTGLAGIANQGATCYLNSLLQTLLFTPEFRERLFDLGPDELGSIADKDKQGSKVRVIPIHLQRLFARLLALNQRSASTAELTDSFGWTNNEELQQHDVQELSRILSCAIEDSLVGTSGQNLISRLYRGTIVNQITCEECNRISERPEDFLDLTLAVGGYVGVQDTLRSYYVDEERMEGNNQYRCDQCRKLVNARKGAKLRSLPPVLTLSLLRFSYDFVKLERFKETGHYTFPMEIDMAPYCEQDKGEDSVYELFSVVLHSGSTHGGHYHAFIRDIDSLGTWSEPENELIKLTPDPGSGKEDIIDMKSPQQCLASLLRKHGGPEHALPVDRLCQLLIEETGVSWNKRFKRQYGTFIKFLRKYNDIFELNAAGNRVHLVDPMRGNPSPPSCQAPPPSPQNSPASSPREVGMGAQEPAANGDGRGEGGTSAAKSENRDQSNKERAIARATASVPEPGHCWYDFNDSSVSPIRESALNRQFQGRESAYMLLYRQKSLQRPKEAYSNAYYRMPAWLMAEVETANQELEKQREEFDRKVNEVELTILLSSHHTWTRGALQSRDSLREPLKITLDRRRPVRDLMDMIKQRVPESDSGHECLHTAKELPAGIHLFDAVTDDVEKTLQDHYITDGNLLFLWDGKQVNGTSILTGEGCKPILLILTHQTSTSSKASKTPSPTNQNKSSEFSHGFPKDIRVSELRCMVSDLVGVPQSQLKLSRVQSVPVVLTKADDSRTLVQLGFVDGDKIVAESSGTNSVKAKGDSLAELEAEKHKNSLKLVVENRCVEPNDQGDWDVQTIHFPKEKTVSELKQAIINQLGLYGNERPKDGCRLRISDNALGLLPPLHENQAITDAGIKPSKTIVIECGLPPTSNELTINFSLMNGSKSWDIMLDKSTVATECLNSMLKVADLSGASYHLRKTNWCGEAADIITSMDQTLAQLNIRDGDLLMLEEGRLPPKGFLLLPMWLYPPPYRGQGGVEGQSGGGASSWAPQVQFSNILNSITSAFAGQDIEEPAQRVSTKSELLGEIEISQDATVGDLKNQVMTLPTMSKVVVPTVAFLRLRLLEDGRLGRVFRDNNQILKYAKVNSSCQIAIQILPEEEQIRPNEFVLTIKKRIPETRTYGPAEELAWDAGKAAAPSTLRQAIADRLLMPVERVAMAKHVHKKHEWLVIPEDKKIQDGGRGRGKGTGNKKGKGQNPKPINLKHAPYLIKDGDVFGVVDLEQDPLRKDEFSTTGDDEGKQKLQEEEELKKKWRRDRRNAMSEGGEKSSGKPKRQEVGLTIRVDNFR